MDAYLSQEAYHSLQGLHRLSSRIYRDGFLIGHTRGHRYFVERIFPSERGFFSSFENYLAADRHFHGKLIGFFSFHPDGKKLKKIMKPFAFGQLLLDIQSARKSEMSIKSYIIEYEKEFYLFPIELRFPKRLGSG